jgi:hypothetical protein
MLIVSDPTWFIKELYIDISINASLSGHFSMLNLIFYPILQLSFYPSPVMKSAKFISTIPTLLYFSPFDILTTI